MYIVTSPAIKKPEKDLSFKNVGRGIWKIVGTFFSKNRSYAPCVLLLNGINVYYHTWDKS